MNRYVSKQQGEQHDPTMRIVSALGTAFFIFGIFVPGAHTLMMVGLALLSLSYLL